jgi:hypothetical protein
MMNRRQFSGHLVKGALGASLLGTVVIEEGCSLSSALQEADNILLLLAPLGDGIFSIVEIADPPLALPLAGISKIYDAAVATVESLLAQWAKASAAAQPGILSQAQVAVQELNADAVNLISAAQVKNPTTASQIASITSAVTGEISALLTVIPQIGALGGTTVALRKATFFKGVDTWGQPSAKQWRSRLVKCLKDSTGLPMDTARTALAAKLEALPLK